MWNSCDVTNRGFALSGGLGEEGLWTEFGTEMTDYLHRTPPTSKGHGSG